MTSDFALQGALGALRFPELAREINQRKLTGGLRLTKGQVKKLVYFERGEIYAAASNLAKDSVLALLVQSARLTQTQADEIKGLAAGGGALGELLLERAGVTREGLAQLRAEQITAIIGTLCEWEEGDYQFEEGVKTEGGPLNSVTPDLILEGARRASATKAVGGAFSDPQTRLSLAPGANQIFPGLRLQPQEAFLLTRLDAPMTLAELLSISGFPESETVRSVYALYCAGLITCDAARPAAKPAGKPAAKEPKPAPAPEAMAPGQADQDWQRDWCAWPPSSTSRKMIT